MKRKNAVMTVATGFLLFLLTSAVSVTFALFAYGRLEQRGASLGTIALVMLLVVVFLAIIFTIADVIRRRITVDKPTEQILSATERIAAGDFSVRLQTEHHYENYDQYDEIKENINLMAAELRKSEVLKSDFISNVSHELKTPLSIIHSYAELLKKEDLDEELRKKYCDILVQASKRLSDLVTNILKLNKLENQKLLPELSKFSLDECLAERVIALEELIEKKALTLDLSLDEMEVYSSKSYLEIVFSNLLSNAIKFTNEGGRVALTCKKEGKNAVVCVEDNGCGISAETGKHIFDKFYQGDTSHAKEGNGLGLALVKKVIDVLGGEISVQSEEGKGSAFTVVLKDAVV